MNLRIYSESTLACLRNSRLGLAVVVIGFVGCSATPAQVQDGVATSQFQVGTSVLAPRSLDPAIATSPALKCEMICSAFNPRQSIAQVLWPEQTTIDAAPDGGQSVDLGTLRLDLIGAAGSFEDGDFGTVRLSAVPVVEAPPEMGIDLQRIRTAVTPTIFQPIRGNRVLARDPALPDPQELSTLRIPGALEQFSAAAREAIDRDTRTGGLGSIQLIAQSVHSRRTVPFRTVVIEGLQPGLTYKIRLVQQTQSEAESLAQGICRVPVCPADFVEQ